MNHLHYIKINYFLGNEKKNCFKFKLLIKFDFIFLLKSRYHSYRFQLIFP